MRKSFVYIIFFLLAFHGFSQAKITNEVKQQAQDLIDAGDNVGISIAFVNGDTVDYYNSGTTDLRNNVLVNEESIYEIGSISKVFTCIVLADEVLKGNMNLSDPISKYLPEHVKAPSRNGKEITLQDLATHTSSLPRMPDNFTPSNPANPYEDYTFEQVYEFLNSCELKRDIGSKYEYSNYGMGLLGHILELHTGKSYEELIAERITKFCNMPNTRLVLTDNMLEHLAKPHAQGSEVSNWDIISLAGAGGIRSNTKDMVAFLKANLGITQSSINAAMQLSHQLAYENKSNNFKIGLGWHYAQNGSDTIIWHNGATGGYNSFTGFIKGTQIGVVVLANSDGDVGRLGMKLLGDPRPFEKPKVSIARILNKEIDANGVEKGIAMYNKLKQERPNDYKFDENQLNTLAYAYLNKDENDIALALFKLNVEAFPKSSNPYDSLGEGYLKVGDTAQAIINYKKSLELNPANDNATNVLLKLGVDKSELIKQVDIPTEVLESYCGKYELTPGFIITITRKDNQLYLQATGQPQFEIFASDYNKFYLKVVDAQITFNANNKGKIDSLTLHQNNQDMPAKRIE